MLHEPAAPSGVDHASAYKTRLGFVLFIVYALIYAGFVAISLYDVTILERIVFRGLNLAVVYGFGLIVFALLLALFFGTAALPHILIRYYTVRTPACARKSTIVAIAAIGFFYILTMYLGLGAMINRVVNPASDNMSAPLLAKSFNSLLFAVISAIAFATVLGTVSGLIVAASGAVAHDIMDRFGNLKMNEKQKVMAGKLAAFTVGLVAIPASFLTLIIVSLLTQKKNQTATA